MVIKLGVLTISTSGAVGRRRDTSGRVIQEVLASPEYQLCRYEVVADDVAAIGERLRRWADEEGLDLIVTTGGTGLSPRDLTPEATRGVLHREVPGMAEAMRMETLKQTPMAMVSRSVVGVRGRTLIVNLPGSPTGVRQCLEVVKPALGHALEMIRGEPAPTYHPH